MLLSSLVYASPEIAARASRKHGTFASIASVRAALDSSIYVLSWQMIDTNMSWGMLLLPLPDPASQCRDTICNSLEERKHPQSMCIEMHVYSTYTISERGGPRDVNRILSEYLAQGGSQGFASPSAAALPPRKGAAVSLRVAAAQVCWRFCCAHLPRLQLVEDENLDTMPVIDERQPADDGHRVLVHWRNPRFVPQSKTKFARGEHLCLDPRLHHPGQNQFRVLNTSAR